MEALEEANKPTTPSDNKPSEQPTTPSDNKPSETPTTLSDDEPSKNEPAETPAEDEPSESPADSGETETIVIPAGKTETKAAGKKQAVSTSSVQKTVSAPAASASKAPAGSSTTLPQTGEKPEQVCLLDWDHGLTGQCGSLRLWPEQEERKINKLSKKNTLNKIQCVFN